MALHTRHTQNDVVGFKQIYWNWESCYRYIMDYLWDVVIESQLLLTVYSCKGNDLCSSLPLPYEWHDVHTIVKNMHCDLLPNHLLCKSNCGVRKL